MRIVTPSSSSVFLLGLLAISSVFQAQVQVDAFQTRTISRPPFVALASPITTTGNTRSRSSSSSSSLHVVGPEHVQLVQDSLLNLNFHPALTLLSDAAETAVKEDSGWWASYLQIFKGTLQGVHDVIDPPLRSAGITQTWGLSIFLFTAGKLYIV
jgi:hypothetical protein